MNHTYKRLSNAMIIIYFFTFLFTTVNTFAQNIYYNLDIKIAEQMAIKHSEFIIKRNFKSAVSLMLLSDLQQLEKDILMILNEGKKYGIIFPFYSQMNIDTNKSPSAYSDGSILIRYCESAYGKQTKDYHQKVLESLKVIGAKIISENTVKVKYSFDAYGAEEPVSLEYEKNLFYDNDQWYVTKDLPEGRMVENLKNRIESKKKGGNNQ